MQVFYVEKCSVHYVHYACLCVPAPYIPEPHSILATQTPTFLPTTASTHSRCSVCPGGKHKGEAEKGHFNNSLVSSFALTPFWTPKSPSRVDLVVYEFPSILSSPSLYFQKLSFPTEMCPALRPEVMLVWVLF